MENLPPPRNLSRRSVAILAGAILFTSFLYILLFRAPGDFPAGALIKVEPGMSLGVISLRLKDEGIIRSRIVFEALVIVRGRERRAVSTDYYFGEKISVFEVARRVAEGKSSQPKIKVTIPEGFANKEIAATFSLKLANFNHDEFIVTAESKAGYLFPDTYFFFPYATADDVIEFMVSNFESKIAPLRKEIEAQGKNLEEIIVMASLIEKEARGDDDRHIISGILWKRISLGRALEVDAEPSTYKSKGLPESPISNPGLESIRAAIFPENSPYLYYLHDSEGNIHYARTFDEHKANKAKYLKK